MKRIALSLIVGFALCSYSQAACSSAGCGRAALSRLKAAVVRPFRLSYRLRGRFK